MVNTTAPRIALAWWPPEPDEPLGVERARELVTALKPVVGPVVAEAEADLRTYLPPGTEVDRHGAPVQWLAEQRRVPEIVGLCIGAVAAMPVGTLWQHALTLHWDGTVTWQRGSRCRQQDARAAERHGP